MPTIQPISQLVKIRPQELTNEENMLLEIELFSWMLDEIEKAFTDKTHTETELVNFSDETENTMIDVNIIKYLINDILESDEYSIAGIAYYTRIPEDIIYEIAAGINDYISLGFSQRIIELHRFVRNDAYQDILNKLRDKVNYQSVSEQ